MKTLNALRYFVLIVLVVGFSSLVTLQAEESAAPTDGLSFSVSFTNAVSDEALDGRLILLISNDFSREPRFQVRAYGLNTQLVFGIDVDGLRPNESATFDGDVFGFPVRSLNQIPPGEYQVQAVLHKYETFRRSDGHVLKLPMDRGEGQQWNRAPGNLLSKPKKITITADAGQSFKIMMDRKMPDIPAPRDTKYIKHIKIQSTLLSEFWGRPMHLGAVLLLPEGFDDHPDARYPLMINHGHFPYTFRGFSEHPPAASSSGRMRSYLQSAHEFYKRWTGPDFPRVIIMLVQHANPYYDDSYAVNTANVGPYGDAITHELIPHVEKEFRGIGEGWARTLYGGSTGGWEALAVQIFYPDDYNGCWAFCPDSVDFSAYQTVNVYKDKNAYYAESAWKKTARPGVRNYLGHIRATIEEMSHAELALGSKGRSGGQLDIFQAVYGPVGQDGYPKPIWDKLTGEIDHEVAEYWREHYDLRHILERDWKTLGPRLKGKINIYMGDMDTFYLNNSTYLMERFLESTSNPHYGGKVLYGDRGEHCWAGDRIDPKAGRELGVHEYFVPVMADHITRTAPKGADVKSWRY